ncbi:MAG: hypothetical protein WKF66_12675 [Pedobacter sp.]
MNLDQYLTGILPNFVSLPNEGFEAVFDYLDNQHKMPNRSLLIYIDRIVNEMMGSESNVVTYNHLHLEYVTDNQIDLISEFLILKFFHMGLLADANLADSSPIKERIERLDRLIEKDITAKNDSKGKSRAIQTLIAERKQLRKSRKFFEELQRVWPNVSMQPRTLVNISKKEAERLFLRFAGYPFLIDAKLLNEHSSTYVVLNESNMESIMNIKYKEVSFLKVIENVLLFNSASKSEFGKFSLRNLDQLNQRSKTVFRRLLIISVNERSMKFNRLKTVFDRIHSRYNSIAQYPKYNAYTILPIEIEQLTGSVPTRGVPVSFFGSKTCDFWDNALMSIDRYEGLEELRSSKLMDIYSIVINTKIRDLVIDELFSLVRSSSLVTDGTKEVLKSLSEDNLLFLKNDMVLFFNWIISSGWPSNLVSFVSGTTTIILSNLILKHKLLTHELGLFFHLSPKQRFTSWYDYKVESTGCTLILDYIDLGPIPNTYKNNLVEYVQQPYQDIQSTFLAIFFERRYLWSLFNYNKHLYNILNHPIRSRSFAWSSFNNKLLASRPNGQETNFNLESKYNYFQNQQSAAITVEGSKAKSFHPSELFIVTELETDVLMARRLEDLGIYDLSSAYLKAQCLTDLYTDFNIYERIADYEQEEVELKIIRATYNLQANYTAKQLWKVLLRDKVIELGADAVYDQIKQELLLKNRQIVDKGHFLSVWVNPDSDTLLARGKSIFLGICDYLKLPKSYMRIMTRIYNAEKLNKSRSSRKMNLLLSDLINDGCFNEGSLPSLIINNGIERYIKSHDLESIGISGTKMVEELCSLVALLKPQLNLKFVKKIDYN